MSTHVYQPLEGPDHIRLIALHPASSKDAPLEIYFLASTLDDLEGRYEAISYTWGQPILTFALHVDDGTQVCVTENLDRALRYLRYNDRDRLLWADAACINQNGNAEKAVQIPLMVDIFRGAQRVMAWLDPGGDTALEQRGMRIIERLSRKATQPYTVWVGGHEEVIRFINLPWFNRLWIIQEVVFSPEVRLICGDTEIAFPRFIAALSFIQEQVGFFHREDMAIVDAILKIGRLWSCRSVFPAQLLGTPLSPNRSDNDSNDITNLVEKFALYACTDPRDRVFALFSMAANVKPAGYVSDPLASSASEEQGVVCMDIDYSLDVLETYKTFAISCWRERPTHKDMWEALLLRQHSPPPEDWPSWVPDWRVLPKKTLPINDTIIGNNFRVISATRSGICLEAGDRVRLRLDKDNGQLYTARSKIPRQSVGSDHSIESQLFQLCSMANGPETARNPDPSTDERQRPPWMSYTTRFPNLLYRKIGKEVLHLDVDSGPPEDEPHGNLLQRLIEYLSLVTTRTRGRDPQHSPTPTTSRLPNYIHDFERASKDVSNLFVFHDPCTQVNSIGYGIVAPEVGDTIVPMGDMLDGDLVDGTMMVIILRRVCLKERSIADTPTYRFIGSGRIFDPTLVLWALGEEFRSTLTSSHFHNARNKFNIV